MLESTVLHQSRTGPRGQPNDVVGINWKAPTRSHPSPSLVVTCAHQVVVYKPGEERRTHQWSFKPSAATVLSHPAVFLPSRSRYVGVQQGSTLVSWRESEQDVKRPLSSQAAGQIQAVHACPRLGDFFVAVLASGGVALYQGGLRRAAYCDAATGGGDGSGGSAGDARAKAVWSGVRGDRVLVLENIGAATDRVTTFSLSVRGVGSSAVRRDDASAAAADVPASITLVSSHILTKPSGGGGSQDGEMAAATSAAFLGRDSGGSGEGRSVISVAWRTSSGPVWTKSVIGAGGVTEEFARRAGGAVVAGNRRATEHNGNGVVSVSSSNGHGTPKAKSKKPADNQSSVGEGSGAAWASVPAIAAADGGRLLIHSGSGGDASPRLAVWDSSYGVLLEDGVAPEFSSDSGGGVSASRSSGRAVGLKVSGDGAHLAIAAEGKVLVCPLPAQAAGTLSSLLRRKRPSPSAIGGSAIIPAGRGSIFPSIDLSRSFSASTLLGKTGAVEAGKWEVAVVVPFREAEAGVVRSLREAARRKDIGAFEQVLREHQGGGSCSSDGRGEDGRKKRQRGDGGGLSAGVVAAAVELCLANPDAKLWGGLGVLVRSGGVSARHHRGLVAEMVEHASPELLEEVMLQVPDLPEVDAVRILRHFLSQAATLAEASSDPAAAEVAAAVAPVVPSEESGGGPPTKRARGGGTASAGGSPDVANGGGGVVVSVLSPSEKRGVKAKSGGGGDVVKAGKKMKKMGGIEVAAAAGDEDGNGTVIHENAHGDSKAITTNSGHLSNGHAAAHDDGGTSSDSGGGSDAGGTQMVVVAGGGEKGTGAAAAKGQKATSSKKKGVGPRAAAAAAASRAERGVRVALTLPHNEAFLRSALAELSHREVVVVLKILTRLLAEGKTLETGAKPRGQNAALVARGLPPARTESVLAWACAVLDSHFTRLAIGGAADGDLVGTLKALKRAARVEAGCCELLSQVRSLVDEVGRRHAAAEAAAAAAASRRRPSSSSPELFSLRVLTFQ
ncbi:unnamed protein product [Ectocarpus sp. 4 AP-2014]